mgnify:CR=1 FL=1
MGRQNYQERNANRPAPPKVEFQRGAGRGQGNRGRGSKPKTAFETMYQSGKVYGDTSETPTAGMINPRTGKPYSETPGKASSEENALIYNSNTGNYEKPGATPAGRSNTRTTTNPNGVTQTMTNTGAINMPGLADVDMTGIANFNGPSFPTQRETNKITDGYSFTASEFLTNPKNDDGSAVEIPGTGGAAQAIAVGGNTFRPNTFSKGGAGEVAGLDGFKPGGKFAGAPTATDGQSQKDNDIEFGGPSPMDYATSGEEMRRRAAFLDSSNDSLVAMDNVAKGMGMGRGFANVDGKAVAMTSDKRREILQAAPGEAQALKDKWVKSLTVKAEDEPQTASSAQNPTRPSGTSTFNQDQTLDLPGQADAVDYMNNNNEDDFSVIGKGNLNKGAFGNTGYTDLSFDSQKLFL